MKPRVLPLGLLLALAALTVAAQSTEPPPAAPAPKGRLPEAKRTDKGPRSKSVLPDPDLLDGSSYEKEKRPLHGMISEIEMGENEGGKSDKISPDSGPAGAANAKPPEDQPPPAQGGGAPPATAAVTPPPENAAGGSEAAVPAGPAAGASGAQAENLKVPEGATGGGPPDGNKPQVQKIGDASLQIQTLPQNSAGVVGAQGSSSQQYEKKLPSGGSQAGSSGNAGVEKGRVVPKGL